MTCKILFDQWKLKEGDEDITVMKIVVEGKKEGEKLRYTFDLYDEYDPETKTHSMARTTAYTAAMAVRLMASDLYREKGLQLPEQLGSQEKIVNFMLAGLAKRNVIYRKEIKKLVTNQFQN